MATTRITAKKVFELLGSFYWTNNVINLGKAIGHDYDPNRYDTYTEDKFRALTNIANSMQIITPNLLEKLVEAQAQNEVEVEVGANKDAMKEDDYISKTLLNMMERFADKKEGKNGEDYATRRDAALCYTHIEEALLRHRKMIGK